MHVRRPQHTHFLTQRLEVKACLWWVWDDVHACDNVKLNVKSSILQDAKLKVTPLIFYMQFYMQFFMRSTEAIL